MEIPLDSQLEKVEFCVSFSKQKTRISHRRRKSFKKKELDVRRFTNIILGILSRNLVLDLPFHRTFGVFFMLIEEKNIRDCLVCFNY